jgi:hypothetical protein
MNLAYAYRVAASYDYNRDGVIRTSPIGRELDFDWDAKKRTDWNHDGRISIDEFANALARQDVFVGYDREVHSTNPYGVQPGYPYPGGGSPYYPGTPGPVTYPGSGYGYGGGYGGGYYGGGYGYSDTMGNIATGAVVGGAIGYVSGGRNGLGTGAAIGGILGAIGSIFN